MTLTDHLRRAQRILIFTGAGISTGSGIPDFRGPQGAWTRRQPVYYQDFMASDKAQREYWDQKLESWDTFRSARPNAVHYAACTLEAAGKLLMLVTQNVDGLHAQAGTSAQHLLEPYAWKATWARSFPLLCKLPWGRFIAERTIPDLLHGTNAGVNSLTARVYRVVTPRPGPCGVRLMCGHRCWRGF